jgi:hypothetical protein
MGDDAVLEVPEGDGVVGGMQESEGSSMEWSTMSIVSPSNAERRPEHPGRGGSSGPVPDIDLLRGKVGEKIRVLCMGKRKIGFHERAAETLGVEGIVIRRWRIRRILTSNFSSLEASRVGEEKRQTEREMRAICRRERGVELGRN